MKTPLCLQVDSQIATLLRKRAQGCNLTMTQILEAALSGVLLVADEELIAFVADSGVQACPAVVRERLNKREQAVWDAYQTLAADHATESLRHFTLKQFAKESGLYPSEVLQGLVGLVKRGKLCKFQMADLEAHAKIREFFPDREAPQVDHWGPPADVRR